MGSAGLAWGLPPVEHAWLVEARRQPPQLAPFYVEAQQLYSDPSQMTELLTLLMRESPSTHWRKLISAACISDLILSPLENDNSVNMFRPGLIDL